MAHDHFHTPYGMGVFHSVSMDVCIHFPNCFFYLLGDNLPQSHLDVLRGKKHIFVIIILLLSFIGSVFLQHHHYFYFQFFIYLFIYFLDLFFCPLLLFFSCLSVFLLLSFFLFLLFFLFFNFFLSVISVYVPFFLRSGPCSPTPPSPDPASVDS